LAVQPIFKNWINLNNGDDLAQRETGIIIFIFKHLSIYSWMLHLFTDQQKYSIGDCSFDFDKLMEKDLYNIDNETGILIYKSSSTLFIFL